MSTHLAEVFSIEVLFHTSRGVLCWTLFGVLSIKTRIQERDVVVWLFCNMPVLL